MTGLANQLRAGLYLLLHDAYFKGATVVLAMWLSAYGLLTLLPDDGVTFAFSLGSTFALSFRLVAFFTCFAMMGLAVHDTAAGGMRAAALAGRGRAGYVASRMLLAPLVAVVLAAVATVLLAVMGAMLPRALVPGPSAVAEVASQLPAYLLASWTYAAVGMVLVWAFPRERGIGTVLLGSVVLVTGLLETAVLMAFVIVPLAFSPELAWDLLSALQPASLSMALQGSLEVGSGYVVLLAVVYLGVAWLLAWRLWARRAV